MNLLALPTVVSLDPTRLSHAEIDGLYVHVPFCFHKCHYCDFYSITRQGEDRMERFVELLLREAELWQKCLPVAPLRPRTIFFGGGTPTLLPEPLMNRLLTGLRERIDLGRVDEWTVEANPATVRQTYCAMMRDTGVDRLSFGAQSFNLEELATLERHHDPADVSRSIEIARAVGFQRLNVDLIYAIPGQDVASWGHSLQAAIDLKTPHVSCYNLTYEPNTPMAVKQRLGRLRAVEENIELDMLRHTRQCMTTAGYTAYEISNYARTGEPCRHNLNYWTGGNYIGIGPSAASHVEGWRWKNRPHLGEWETALSKNALPASDVETLSPDQRAGELAMLMLRLECGLPFAHFEAKTGRDARQVFADPIDRFERVGLIVTDERAIRLTDRGIPVADAIAAEFLEHAGAAN